MNASRPPAAPRLLLVCLEYADAGHTGGMRWRAIVPTLIARGWRVDVIARRPEAPSTAHETAPRSDAVIESAAGLSVYLVTTDGAIGRWRKRRRARFLARQRRAHATEPAPSIGDGIAPADVPTYRPHAGARAWSLALLDTLETRGIVKRVAARAHELLDREPADLMLVTSPLHLVHEVGVALADRLPFIAEYRDPLYYGRGPSRGALDAVTQAVWRRAEHRTLRRATHIIDISDGVTAARHAELLAERPGHRVPPHSVVPSGYRDDEPAPVAVDRERFRIVYVGWLWPFMPVPETLASIGAFRATLDGALGPADERLSVEFIGSEDSFRGCSLDAIAAGAGLDGRFVTRPRVPRDEASDVQARAAVSLLFDSVCREPVCIPSKLYHSARCHGDLLPIGATDGAMAREAARIGTLTRAPDHAAGIVAALHAALARWQRGEMIEPADRVGEFHIERRADVLEPVLRRLATARQ